MKQQYVIIRVLLLFLIMAFGIEKIDAKVTWKYVRSPKYKTELRTEYNKIPQKARDLYDEKDLKIIIYGYNYYPSYAGLFNRNVNIESYQISWLKSFYKHRGVKTNLSTKKLSINYAKCTLIHELGHAYDFNNGWISKQSEFKNIYKKEKNKFTKTAYYKYPMGKIKDNINNVQEYFASSFTVYVRSPKDLKKNCPKTYAYFDILFK